jgi:hypothetical protein
MSFAASRVIANAMFAGGPKMLVGSVGDEIPADRMFGDASDAAEIRHNTFLPRIVSARSASDADVFASVANYLIHPHVPRWQPRRALANASPEDLASHLLDPEVVQLLENDPPRALAIRAARIQDATDAFLARRAAWGASDRPGIADLNLDEEVLP